MTSRCFPLAVLFLCLVTISALAQPSATVRLSPRLQQWKTEIESARGGRVVAARVFMEPVKKLVFLPKDAEQRPVITLYLKNQNFLNEFLATHAMNINHEGADGWNHIVLLNMSRVNEWGLYEEQVLAHEFGHIWLYAQNYVFPSYEGKELSCLSMLATDAVQHVLIREEMESRDFHYNEYMLDMLEQTVAALEQAEPGSGDKLPVCPLMAKLLLWTDVRMSQSAETWTGFDRFEAAMERVYPLLGKMASECCEMLRKADLSDMKAYQITLENMLHKYYGFAEQVIGSDRPAR